MEWLSRSLLSQSTYLYYGRIHASPPEVCEIFGRSQNASTNEFELQTDLHKLDLVNFRTKQRFQIYDATHPSSFVKG